MPGYVGVLGKQLTAPGGGSFPEDFTGTNGDPWDSSLWNISNNGSSSLADIQSNTGRQRAGGTSYASSNAYSIPTFTDVNIKVSITLDVNTGERYQIVYARRQSDNDYYMIFMQPNNIGLYKKVSSSDTLLGSNHSFTPGTNKYWIRFVCHGSNIKFRFWADSVSEPLTWHTEVTDTTFTTAGPIGLLVVTGSDATSRDTFWDDVSVSTTFDLTWISWLSSFWAEDASWTNPGNGNGVSSWRDAGSRAVDAAQSTGANQPTFRSSYSNLNSKPAIEFDGSNDYLTQASGSTAAQPNHFVVIGHADGTGGGAPTLFSGGGGDDEEARLYHFTSAFYYAGNGRAAGTGFSSGVFIAFVLFDGDSSYFKINGTNQISSNHPGSLGVGPLRIGDSTSPSSTTAFDGAIAFIGVKDSAFSTPEINSLTAWAQSYYGAP